MLQKNFYFRVAVDPGRGEIEKTFWNSIAGSNDAADFEAYLRIYPGGSYAALAENRIRRLKTAPQQAAAAAPPPAPSGAYDGRWTVSLTCESVRDKGKFVKGFNKNFSMDVKEGRLSGQQGPVGAPATLTLAGVIQDDGTAQIAANGINGDPEFSMGHAPFGSRYSYAMRGSFTQATGHAVRISGQRPCAATFHRN